MYRLEYNLNKLANCPGISVFYEFFSCWQPENCIKYDNGALILSSIAIKNMLDTFN